MLQSISWQIYLKLIAFILIGYYMVIGYLYYRNDLLAGFRQLVRTGKPGLDQGAGPGIPEHNVVSPELVASFQDELKAFTRASGTSGNRNELLYMIGKLLQKYKPLKQAGINESISVMIINECLENCGVSIAQNEIEVLLNG